MSGEVFYGTFEHSNAIAGLGSSTGFRILCHPRAFTEEIDKTPVGITAEHTCLGVHSCDFGIVVPLGTILMKVVDEYRCNLGEVVLTRVSSIDPFVVVAPGVEVEYGVTGVIPFVGDEEFVGYDFLKVEVAAEERACTAVRNVEAVASEEVVVHAGEYALHVCFGCDLGDGVGIIGLNVEVADTRAGGEHGADRYEAGNQIFGEFHILSFKRIR